MAKTFHHDRKRFHPWENTRATEREADLYCDRWERRYGWRPTNAGYINVATAGPKWWRRVQMERPMRRRVHMLERRCCIELEQIWPLPRKPTRYYY